MRPLAFLPLFVTLGCGAASTAPTAAEGTWRAHPPTVTVTCGAAAPMCTDAASLRIRWPDGAHAPDGAHVTIDATPVEPTEAELAVCVTPGVHPLHIDGMAPLSVEILPGTETRLALSTVPGGMQGEATIGALDVGAVIASLGQADLPSIAYDARPDERRVYAPVLADGFDAWRARLARVVAISAQTANEALHAAALDHEARANEIALTIREDRPSADRLAAIRRAMASEIVASSTMIPIERSCPLYGERDPDATLAGVTVEARPYVGPRTSVVRIRVAIDDVEVLDTGVAHGVELFDRTVADGVVPPGDHVVVAEVTFADRGGAMPRRPVLPQARIHVASLSTRVLVRALGNGTVEITTP